MLVLSDGPLQPPASCPCLVVSVFVHRECWVLGTGEDFGDVHLSTEHNSSGCVGRCILDWNLLRASEFAD